MNGEEQAIASKLVGAPGQNRPFMKWNATLSQVARARAADMANRGYFAHQNPDGLGANALIRKAGYKLPDYFPNGGANNVESIAAGRSSSGDTWSDWMGSPGHKDHLLANNSFYQTETNYGVGYVQDPSSPYQYYWVVITAPPEPDPLLTVTAPANSTRVTTPNVTVTGKTSAESNTASVVVRVENSTATSAFVTASGTSNFTVASPTLAPGANTIRVRSLNSSGGLIADVLRTITYVVVKPLNVSINGDGSVTSGFEGTTSRELGQRLTIAAKASAETLFSGWTGTISSSSATLSFVMAEGMTLHANFVPNPFKGHAGGFSGLAGGDTATTAHFSMTDNGAFTGSIRVDGVAYAVRGRLNADGTATVQIPRRDSTPINVSLRYDIASGGNINVSVTADGATASLNAVADYRMATAGEFAGAGRYTVSMPPDAGSAAAADDMGNGWATLLVTKRGRTRLTGSLANGTRVSVGGVVSGAKVLPVYVPLYRRQGELAGNLTLKGTSVSDLSGKLHWSKPAVNTARVSTPAIDMTLAAVGSAYVRPASGLTVLHVTPGENNGKLVLNGGDLQANVVQPITIDPTNRVSAETETAIERPRLTINAVSGIFSGSFTHPATGKRSTLRGVILQKQNAGYGYFNGLAESGSVALSPMQ